MRNLFGNRYQNQSLESEVTSSDTIPAGTAAELQGNTTEYPGVEVTEYGLDLPAELKEGGFAPVQLTPEQAAAYFESIGKAEIADGIKRGDIVLEEDIAVGEQSH